MGRIPSPTGLVLSVSSLVSYFTTSVSHFPIERNMLCRAKNMKEGATMAKIKELVSLLVPGLLQRGLEEGTIRYLSQDPKWSQQVELFDAMFVHRQDPDKWEAGSMCPHFRLKMPRRDFLCGCRDRRLCQREAAPKPKGGQLTLATLAAEYRRIRGESSPAPTRTTQELVSGLMTIPSSAQVRATSC